MIKQKAQGPHRSLDKQFEQSMNIPACWLKEKQWNESFSPFWNKRMVLHLRIREFPLTQGCSIVPILAEIDWVVLRKGCGPSFAKTWFPFTQKWFLSPLFEICLERKRFLYKHHQMNVFSLCHYHLPLEKSVLPLICKNLNSLPPGMFCAMFWSSPSWK